MKRRGATRPAGETQAICTPQEPTDQASHGNDAVTPCSQRFPANGATYRLPTFRRCENRSPRAGNDSRSSIRGANADRCAPRGSGVPPNTRPGHRHRHECAWQDRSPGGTHSGGHFGETMAPGGAPARCTAFRRWPCEEWAARSFPPFQFGYDSMPTVSPGACLLRNEALMEVYMVHDGCDCLVSPRRRTSHRRTARQGSRYAVRSFGAPWAARC